MQELVHGGDWAGFAERYGVEPLDFSANISPLGLPEGVQRAICEAAATANRYPDPHCRRLCRLIAQHEGVQPQQVLCGNGAADLIYRVVQSQRPRCAVVTAPTFAEYELALATVGCRVKSSLLLRENGFAVTDDLLREITPEVELVFLCQPNNPTGVVTPRDRLLALLARCEEVGALLVLDECFVSFLDDPAQHSLVNVLNEHPRLIILKAFTKLYAMAGVRLGYCLSADEQLLAQMQAAGQPWAVSTIAEAAGVAALQEHDYVERLRSLIATERRWLAEQLRLLGVVELYGSANYLLFCCDTPLVSPMAARGIMLRSCANYLGLGDSWYRVAVRTRADNERLVAALGEVIT